MGDVIGWDIGGVHTKAVRLPARGTAPVRAASHPFEIWREPHRLTRVLDDVLEELGDGDVDGMAVTMTAELSDAFATKREGVLFVTRAVEHAAGPVPTTFLSLDGTLEPLDQVYCRPLDFAAANWLASALYIASRHPHAVLLDVGSTTTDIIPIQGGRVAAEGRTDRERLTSGELIYTGVVRTNPNTLTDRVPVQGRMCRLAAENFAVMGDVYRLLGLISADQYSTRPPDGRDKSPCAAAARLARLVCADAETLDDQAVRELARYLHQRQLHQITEGLLQVLSRLRRGRQLPLVAVGMGRFLAAEISRRLDLPLIDLEEQLGPKLAAVFPSLAVASLMAERLDKEGTCCTR